MSAMIFSKEAFLSSDSGRHLKALLGCHLDAIDGLPVEAGGDGLGCILYEIDGKEWELYPVMPEWCKAQSQLSLFELYDNRK